jgi:predicted unusual protein kinase regulating ubiquinone biosynthesis (AarF/ABC1/UbiB family)
MGTNDHKPPTRAFHRASKLVGLATSLTRQEVTRRLTGKKDEAKSALLQIKQATLLVKELGNLKGAAMKVGQMITLEARDYLPEEVVNILENLYNQVSFMPLSTVEQILREDLGERAERLRSFSPTPIAAASIGQVHRATLEGRPVAVKVQYPGIRDSIDSDIRVLSGILKTLATVLRRDVEIDGLIQEFAEVFKQETDYVEEAKLSAEYRQRASALRGLVVPEVFPEVSSPRVLTMTFEAGTPWNEWIKSPLATPGLRLGYAKKILQLYVHEFCDWGLVQTDPNAGNFLLRPETEEWIALDFGATKRYSPEFRVQYSKLAMAIFHRDDRAVIDISVAMGLIDPREGEPALEVFRKLLYESMRPFSVPEFDFAHNEVAANARVLTKQLAKELRFSPPPKTLIFLHRKLAGIYFLLRQLEVKLDLMPYLARFEALATQ